MNFSDRDPAVWDAAYDAISTVEHLPTSQAFEQVMYDQLAQRVVVFHSDHPITFSPVLARKNFPEELRDYFVFTHNFTIDNFRAVQLLHRDEDDALQHSSKMVFTVNEIEYTLILQGFTDATISTTTENGDNTLPIAPHLYTALLASILYAAEYAHTGNSDATLIPDPLLRRHSTQADTESLTEQILLTFGNLTGQTTTTTTSIFPSDETLLQATLVSVENPRLSGIQSTVHLTQIDSKSYTDTSLQQHETHQPDKKLARHFAEKHDMQAGLTNTIFPDDQEEWANMCLDFHARIKPLIRVYEEIEEQHD